MRKDTRYLRIPRDVIDTRLRTRLLEDMLVVSSGFRCGHNRNIGYNVVRNPGEEYLVKYCVNGYGWLEVQGVKYTVGPGDVIICENHVPHKYGADTGNPWSVYWSYFAGRSASDYYKCMNPANDNHVFHIGYDSFVGQMFDSIITVMEKGYASHYMVHASNMLKLILSHMVIGLEHSTRKNKKENELEKIVQFMLDNVDKQITLEHMAAGTNFSKDHFIKIFRRRFGYTPMDYFIRMKMQKACELLATTDYSISRIAETLGYADCYYLSRLFKSKTGSSPRQFRKNFLSERTFFDPHLFNDNQR
jgi:AraC family transcriptional regulator of arabinose operon